MSCNSKFCTSQLRSESQNTRNKCFFGIISLSRNNFFQILRYWCNYFPAKSVEAASLMLFGFVKSVFQSQEKFLKVGELLRFTLLQRAKEKAISVWELQNNPTFMQICLVVFDFNILRSKIFPNWLLKKNILMNPRFFFLRIPVQ